MTKRQLYHTAWLGKSSAMEPRCGLQWVVVQSTVPAQNYCAKLFFGVQLHFNIQWYFQNKIVKDLLLFTLKLIQITIRIYAEISSDFSDTKTVVGVSEQLIRSLDPTLTCRKTPVINLNVGRYPTLACRKTPVTNLNLGKRPSFACRKTPVTNLNVGNSTVRCCSVCVRKERVRTQYCSCAVCVCVWEKTLRRTLLFSKQTAFKIADTVVRLSSVKSEHYRLRAKRARATECEAFYPMPLKPLCSAEWRI